MLETEQSNDGGSLIKTRPPSAALILLCAVSMPTCFVAASQPQVLSDLLLPLRADTRSCSAQGHYSHAGFLAAQQGIAQHFHHGGADGSGAQQHQQQHHVGVDAGAMLNSQACTVDSSRRTRVSMLQLVTPSCGHMNFVGPHHIISCSLTCSTHCEEMQADTMVRRADSDAMLSI